MLQRSAYSFRRQGSSGHIWKTQIETFEPQDLIESANASNARENVPLQIHEQKDNKMQRLQSKKIVHSNSSPLSPVSSSSSSSEFGNKVRRSCFCTIFGLCGGSSKS